MDKWLRNNNVVKVVALLIGVLLWFVVHMDVQSTTTTPSPTVSEDRISNVKVTPKYDSEQYNIQSMEPSEVSVVIRGKNTSLKKITPNSLQLEVDLSKLGAGEHVVPVIAVGGFGSATVDVYPSTVRVVLESKKKKEVPVTITVTGTPADGKTAGQPVIQPNRVHVTVPESLLDEVESARGEISVDKATSTVKKQVKLTAYDRNGKAIDGLINPQLVDVEVPVTAPFKKMPLQVKLNGQPETGFSVATVTQDQEEVTVYGPQEILDKMDFYEGLQVDLTGLKETKSFALDIPLKKNIVQVEPNKVNIKVEVVPSALRTFDNIPITLTGAAEGMTAKLAIPVTGTISALLEGAPALLDKLSPQDIQASVDVTNLPQGRHELTVTLNLPIFIKKPAQEFKALVDISGTPANPASATASPSASGSATPAASPSPSASSSAQASASPTPTPSPASR